MFDIIPDIHGQYEKLVHALRRLGYGRRNGAWRHSDPARTCVFLGDFIDRGPQNSDVIQVVREMQAAGTAIAVMGNHELNAIHFHSNSPESGKPLRAWSQKNLRQHHSFLAEFSANGPATREVIGWMRTLPLYQELDGFRVVHACWDEQHIAKLERISTSGVLSDAQLIRVADPKDPLHNMVETITKGPEASLPEGRGFIDKDGNYRKAVRVKWWNADGRSWADIAMSVPHPADLPDGDLPAHVSATAYPESAKPVLFGHYWMTGTPVLQAKTALCLDYSAGKDGPLVSYRMEAGQALSLDNLVIHTP